MMIKRRIELAVLLVLLLALGLGAAEAGAAGVCVVGRAIACDLLFETFQIDNVTHPPAQCCASESRSSGDIGDVSRISSARRCAELHHEVRCPEPSPRPPRCPSDVSRGGIQSCTTTWHALASI